MEIDRLSSMRRRGGQAAARARARSEKAKRNRTQQKMETVGAACMRRDRLDLVVF